MKFPVFAVLAAGVLLVVAAKQFGWFKTTQTASGKPVNTMPTGTVGGVVSTPTDTNSQSVPANTGNTNTGSSPTSTTTSTGSGTTQANTNTGNANSGGASAAIASAPSGTVQTNSLIVTTLAG